MAKATIKAVAMPIPKNIDEILKDQAAKELTPEQTYDVVIKALRQHPPDTQNGIVRILLKQLAYDREDEYQSKRSASDHAAKNLDEFLGIVPTAEAELKARAQQADNTPMPVRF